MREPGALDEISGVGTGMRLRARLEVDATTPLSRTKEGAAGGR